MSLTFPTTTSPSPSTRRARLPKKSSASCSKASSQRIQRTKTDRSMTFLAAWKESKDSFIVGADSYACKVVPLEDFYEWYPVDKIEKLSIENGRLAWGYRGSSKRGDELKGFLCAHRRFESWEYLYDVLKEKVQAINSCSVPDPNSHLSVIIAGWIGDHPDILCIGMNGRQQCSEMGAYFIGPGERVVAGKWRTAQKTVESFREILDRITDTAVGLRGPAKLWRLTPDSFEEIP